MTLGVNSIVMISQVTNQNHGLNLHLFRSSFIFFQFNSVQFPSHVWLFADCSKTGLPVHHQCPDFTQTHVYWVSDAIQPSHPLVVPFSSGLQSFPASGSFQMSQFFASGGQSIGVSASISVLPMNTQDWFPLGWIGWISSQSKGLSRVFSNTTVQKHQFFGGFLYPPTLTSIHDYWKNHSFDYWDICWQSNVSVFYYVV